MELDLKKLGFNTDILLKILRAFSEANANTMRIIAKGDLLRMFASNDGRRFTDATTTNFVSVYSSYLGQEDRCFIKPKRLAQIISEQPKGVIHLEGIAYPMGWDEELLERHFEDGEEFSPEELKKALSYLLRMDYANKPGDYFGVIFKGTELISTNGSMMFIHGGMPCLVNEPRLLGFDAAAGIYSMLRTPYVHSVQMSVAKKSGLFGVRLYLEDDIEMFFWSKPRWTPIDSYRDPRPALHPSSVGFVVQTAYLEQLVTSTQQVMQELETAVVYLRTMPEGLLYQSYGADEYNLTAPRPIYQGMLPMVRSMANQADVEVCLKASHLLEVIKGAGENTQFIVPYHDALGLEIHPIEPFYINCNSQQFALIAPFTLDPNRVRHLEKLRRKVNNMKEAAEAF